MTNKKVFPALCALFLILSHSIGYGGSPTWPLKRQIDLSSGYGDYRSARFHAGLDLRTGGVPGAPVHAPVDGYVWRIKMSYDGYGKGLYLKGTDGYIYVFGHLQRFADQLDRRVKLEQTAQTRYYVDLEFPADSIRVKAGELIAYSGQTGAGAPHLHFEKRTADNFPLNPLANGFQISDRFPPVFTQVGFQMTDDVSLFASGTRKQFIPVRAKGGKSFVFDSVLYFNRPFGLLTDCFDRLRKDGPEFSVFRMQLFLDDSLWYETVFDTVDYATTSSANSEYDYSSVMQKKGSVRRLFRARGNDFAGSRGRGGADGTIGSDPNFRLGLHKARVEATDAVGNLSQLSFSFYWGPSDGIYALDSLVQVNDSNTVFYFTPKVDFRLFDLDSALVFLNKGKRWGPVRTVYVRLGADGKIVADAQGYLLDRRTFRLALYTNNHCRIDEEPFNGLQDPGTTRMGVTHQLTDEGLFATINTGALSGAYARVELYWRDTLLGIEYPSRYFTMEHQTIFIPPLPKYARVDEFRGILSRDTSRPAVMRDTVNVVVVGLEENQEIRVDSSTALVVNKDDFFEPRFVELRRNEIRNKVALKLNSEHYELLPETLSLKRPLELRLNYTTTLADSGRTALYRLDKEANRWKWINEKRDGMTLFGKIDRGGSIAAVYDFDPPIISKLTPANAERVRDLRPRIQFTMTDSLSWFEDDRNILIKLDGKWQIPEFDPETGICWTQPMEPLAPGNHHLSVEITDRVGNKAAQYLQFMVLPGVTPAKR